MQKLFLLNKLRNKYKNEGYDKGYSDALKFCEEYYEKSPTLEEKQIINKPLTNEEAFNKLDEFLLWAKIVHEICHTEFFRTYLFEHHTVEQMDEMILDIDYLLEKEQIASAYPEAYSCLPDILMSLLMIKENKQVINSAFRKEK